MTCCFSSAPASGIVIIPAGANIQPYVDANPAGMTYQLSAGTYTGQTVWPKSGDTYYGAAGLATVLDGGGGSSERHAFSAYSGTINVTIDGLVIKNYVDSPNSNLTRGVLNISPSNPGWTLRNSDIGPNVGVGVEVVSGMTVRNNKIHDNSWLGINGYTGSSNIVVDNNDIYNNNTSHDSPYVYSGHDVAFAAGIKIFNCSYITFLNNRIHGNYGFGLWFDADWHHVTVTGNEIYGQLRDTYHTNQAGIGLMLEIGLAGGDYLSNIINDNYIHDEDVGMLIATSGDLDIYGNAFAGNRIATIRAFEDPRGNGANGVIRQEQHVHIHDNWFAYSQGVNSQRDEDSVFLWYNQDNTYTNNTYYISCGNADFAYQGEKWVDTNNRVGSYTQWMALPSNPDSTSTFNCGQTSLPVGVGPRGGYVG